MPVKESIHWVLGLSSRDRRRLWGRALPPAHLQEGPPVPYVRTQLIIGEVSVASQVLIIEGLTGREGNTGLAQQVLLTAVEFLCFQVGPLR